jgi:hypothetical protein
VSDGLGEWLKDQPALDKVRRERVMMIQLQSWREQLTRIGGKWQLNLFVSALNICHGDVSSSRPIEGKDVSRAESGIQLIDLP